jgi:hypothetical protein
LDGPEVVDEEELCIKCGEALSDEDKGTLGKLSKQKVHGTCVGTYKCVMRKVHKDAKFSAWWAGKAEEEKAAYYQERRAPKLKGEKRKLHTVVSTSKEVSRAGSSKLVKNNWIPFKVFDDRQIMKGEMDPKKRTAAWNALLLEPDVKTMEWSGQTLVYEFGGLETNDFEDRYKQNELAASRKLHSNKELADARAEATQNMQIHSQALEARSSKLQVAQDPSAQLPKTAIQGWTSLDEVFGFVPAAADDTSMSDIDLIITIEDEVQQAEKELNDRDRIDMEIWEASNKTLVDDIQQKHDDKHIVKFKVSIELRLTQAASLFETAVSDCKADSRDIVKLATATFGVDDWKEFPMMKEQVDSVTKDACRLDEIIADFNKQSKELQDKLKGSQVAKVCKGILEELTKLRSDKMKELGVAKKSAASVRAAVKKVEKGRGQVVQPLGLPEGENESANLVPVVVGQVCVEKGNFINAQTDFEVAWTATPKKCFAVHKDEWATDFMNLPVVKGLQRWLTTQKVNKEKVLGDKSEKAPDRKVCILEKESYCKPILDFIGKATAISEDKLLARLQSATHGKSVVSIFQPQLIQTDVSWNKTSFQEYCVGQFIFLAEGEVLLVGVPSDELQGWSYSKKVHELSSWSAETLKERLQQPTTFVLKLKAGSFVYIPSQYIVRTHVLQKCSLLRWSSFDGNDPTEGRKVLASCLSVASSFPEMAQGTYQAWMSCLQESLAKVPPPASSA